MKAKLFSLFICLFLSSSATFALSFNKLPKLKITKKEKVRMVETKAEWEEQSEAPPVEERKLNDYEAPKSTKKFYYPDPKYRFEKYNYPAGSKENNIADINRMRSVYSQLVSDIECRYGAYVRFYNTIDMNHIYSNLYVEKLDTSKTKTKRMVDFNPYSHKERPIIESGSKEFYPHLFQGLTIVDWNRASDKLLVKEKTGSTINGIYQTRLYVYLINKNQVLRLTDLEQAIIDYYLDFEGIQLAKYAYELHPLGFYATDDSVIVTYLYMYDNDNNKIFMGTWGYNCDTHESLLLSRTSSEIEISSNGLILKQVIE